MKKLFLLCGALRSEDVVAHSSDISTYSGSPVFGGVTYSSAQPLFMSVAMPRISDVAAAFKLTPLLGEIHRETEPLGISPKSKFFGLVDGSVVKVDLSHGTIMLVRPLIAEVPKAIVRAMVDEAHAMFRRTAQEALACAGWTPVNGGSALAVKEFETAAGVKSASVHLGKFDSELYNCSLIPEYLSEGRNILSGCSQLLPLKASGFEVRQVTENFEAAISQQISESYAVSLLRQRERNAC